MGFWVGMAWAAPRSHFYYAQHERPHTGEGTGEWARPRFLAGHRNDIVIGSCWGVGFWSWFAFCFVCLGFGSAMEGPGLWCRMTMAPTPTLAASAASCRIPTRAIGGLAGVEGVPGWGNPSCISASTAERDSIRLEPSLWNEVRLW